MRFLSLSFFLLIFPLKMKYIIFSLPQQNREQSLKQRIKFDIETTIRHQTGKQN